MSSCDITQKPGKSRTKHVVGSREVAAHPGWVLKTTTKGNEHNCSLLPRFTCPSGASSKLRPSRRPRRSFCLAAWGRPGLFSRSTCVDLQCVVLRRQSWHGQRRHIGPRCWADRRWHCSWFIKVIQGAMANWLIRQAFGQILGSEHHGWGRKIQLQVREMVECLLFSSDRLKPRKERKL